MTRVSRLDGTELVINAELIELVETTPDTVLSLTAGKKFIVREPLDEVVERVIAYRRRAHQAMPVRASTEESAQA